MESPLRGADGNVEFLVHARTALPARAGRTIDDAIAEAVRL